MHSLFQFTTTPSSCAYLPEQTSRLEYEVVGALSPKEYQQRLMQGWRHFGFAMFHPKCLSCRACQSIRVEVARFQLNRSQKRAVKANEDLRVAIGIPAVTDEKLALYDRFHSFQVDRRNWPEQGQKEAASYIESFVNNPFPIQEWCYYLDGRLIGVGYVDLLPSAMSAIYFFYEPDERHRSLGTFNVLSVIEQAARRRIPHLYLGYFVEGCRSLEYKAAFVPNQVLDADGEWIDFRA